MKVLSALPLVIVLVCSAARAEGQLHLYDFPDYIDTNVIDKFTETYDVEVVIDEVSTYAEILDTLRKGNTGYDVSVAGNWVVQALIQEGLLAEVKPNAMANFKNVDPRWTDVWWDPGRNYSTPYTWGTTAIAVDTAAYAKPVDSLKIIFEPPEELRGKIAVVPERDDVIQAALRYLGKPRCTEDAEDLKSLSALLRGARPSWLVVELYTTDAMLNGDAVVAYTYNGTARFVRNKEPSWRYVYPREGYGGFADSFVVLKNAKNIENAKLFLNFLMDPQIAALNSEFHGVSIANVIPASAKFMSREFLESPEITIPAGTPPPEFVPLCPETVREKYAAIWEVVTK